MIIEEDNFVCKVLVVIFVDNYVRWWNERMWVK